MCSVCLQPEAGSVLLIRRKALLIGGDALALLAFAAVGRRNHGESLNIGSIFSVAWPFLAGAHSSWLLYDLAACLQTQTCHTCMLLGQHVVRLQPLMQGHSHSGDPAL